MAKKKLEGIEFANDRMLKGIAAFLVAKKFYGKELSVEEQEKKAAFDISKRGKLRKLLDASKTFTNYDLVIGRSSEQMNLFEEYGKMIKQYRAQVIKKAFQHRKDECK